MYFQRSREVIDDIEEVIQEARDLEILDQEKDFDLERIDLSDFKSREGTEYGKCRGKKVLECVDEVVEDYRQSYMSLDEYMRECRKIYLRPEKRGVEEDEEREYIYITPLREARYQIEEGTKGYCPYMPVYGDNSDEVDLFDEPEETLTLLGLRFPWWGIGYQNKGEPATPMLWNAINFVESEGKEVDSGVYRLDGKFYQVEKTRSDLKGVFRFLEREEYVKDFFEHSETLQFPAKTYTEEQRELDSAIFRDMRNKIQKNSTQTIYNRSIWTTALEEPMLTMFDKIESELKEKYGDERVRWSLARLKGLGLLGPDFFPKHQDTLTPVADRIEIVEEENMMDELEDAFFDNYLSFASN